MNMPLNDENDYLSNTIDLELENELAGLEHTSLNESEIDNSDNLNLDPVTNFLESTKPTTEVDLVTELLKNKGIIDSKVTIVDENNIEQKVDFFELSPEEQLAILDPEIPENTDDLDDEEISLLNHLRTNKLSVDEFLENYKQSIINELGESEVQNYDIDSYDDQELFLIDLKNKFNLTDEELAKELEKELQDEELFKKKVGILRTEYKQLEDQYKVAQQQEFEQKQQENYDQFSDTMTDVALNTPEFYGIELEDDEKSEVLSFLLDLDENGTSEFYKTLNDPAKLYEAAWFLRYGKESFSVLKDAYESEIARLKKSDKGAVIRKNTNTNQITNIHELN